MQILVCVVVAAVTVMIPSAARGQSVSAGVKGGLLAANLSASGAGSFDTSAEAGFTLGLFGAIKLGTIARLQPELLMTQQRFAISLAGATVKARAVAVPVLMHLRFGGDRRVRPVLFAGPQISFISKVTQQTAQGETDISDNIAGIDTGLTAGAGFEAVAGGGAWVVDARATFGMKDLSEAGPPALKSRAFMLLAGYRF
ncbi:MAG: porin family protein [Vicinamibacterales bacterium]